jgi:hypothetical protein
MMTLVVSRMVDYVHLAVIVHPQFAHDYVVHRGGHFAPSDVIRLATHVRVVTLDVQVGRAQWNDLQILASELGRHAEFLPHFPTPSFAILRCDRRVMTHLHKFTHFQIPTVFTTFRFALDDCQ